MRDNGQSSGQRHNHNTSEKKNKNNVFKGNNFFKMVLTCNVTKRS